jgi:hypothetical protein
LDHELYAQRHHIEAMIGLAACYLVRYVPGCTVDSREGRPVTYIDDEGGTALIPRRGPAALEGVLVASSYMWESNHSSMSSGLSFQ